MKIHAVVPIIIGLALIISAPVVSKTAYAQATMQPSSNGVESGQNSAVKGVTGALLSSLHESSGVGPIGVPAPNLMIPASAIVGSNVKSGQNSAVKGVTGALLSSLHESSGVGTICNPSAFAALTAPISHISTIQGKIFFVTALQEFHRHHHHQSATSDH